MMTRPPVGLIVRNALLGAVALASASVVGSGCLDRPVAPATPTVTARVNDRAKQNKVARIDLLFMIDNSSSMADKQQILSLAVPDLVNRLVDPACIDPATGRVVGQRLGSGACAQGEPDFDPVKDIHIGIITSSLGSHGAAFSGGQEVCPDPDTTKTNAHNKDMSHLVARSITNGTESAVPTFNSLGFLNWTGSGNASTIITPFTSMVAGVGQHGCGYEASLEAIYRFLNDPNPYASITVGGSPQVSTLVGTDTALLKQRADFLRPDSLVAVIAVTDENDCSIDDTNPQGYYPLLPPIGNPPVSQLQRGTAICDTNPNDNCCINCGQTKAGCPATTSDPACQNGGSALPRAKDPENLRCFNQKARYGIDFLFPVDRYVAGLTSTMIRDGRSGMDVANPLFTDLQCVAGKDSSGKDCVSPGTRDATFVFFAGIVGVPWQDIAVDPTDLGQGYKTSKQINDDNVWKNILGDPGNSNGPVAPADLHMIESIGPRAGLPGPDSQANADPINGHEWNTAFNSPPNADLQYACIFPLPTPTVCDVMNTDCDCSDATDPMGGTVTQRANPLCQTGNMYSQTQVRAKAYPGIRELQVLKGLGDQAIVASICPANTTDMTRADFGYRPAIAALISRLRTALRGRCLPRTLEISDTGSVPCVIIEAFNASATSPCDCGDPASPFKGRQVADKDLVTDEMRAQGSCLCEIEQLTGDALTQCTTSLNLDGTVGDGWCYVDPAQQKLKTPTSDITGSCQVVSTCPDTDKRIIRFALDTSQPRGGATAFITCQEASFPSTGGGVAQNPCPATP